MATPEGQSIKAGSGSTNVQAVGSVYVGMDYTEVRAVVLDLFEKNYEILRADATKLAEERAAEVVDALLAKLAKEAPGLLANLAEPSVQRSVVQAQIEHATNGDPDDPDLLANLLLARIKDPSKNPVGIACQSAIEVVGSLSASQMDLLAAMFIVEKIANGAVTTVEGLRSYMGGMLEPFAGAVKSVAANTEADEVALLHELDSARCVIFDSAMSHNIPLTYKSTYAFLSHLPDNEVLTAIAGDNETLKTVWSALDSSRYLKNCFLTNVGKAIAHSNLSRFKPMAGLGTWIY